MDAATASGLIGAGTFLTLVVGLRAVRTARAATGADGDVAAPRTLLERDDAPAPVRWLARPSAPDDPEDRRALALQLAQAGLGRHGGVSDWLALRTLAVVAPGVGGVVVADLVWPSAPAWAVGLACACAGWWIPRAALDLLTAARQRRLARSVPDMLDMLVASVEAGLGVDAAFRQVARELAVADPDLVGEMDEVNTELTAGVPRQDALRGLYERTGIEELGALVSVLGQAERDGAGVAGSLRAHANLARRRRALRAEHRAARASPLLTVAMIVFILPALFVVLVGPAVLHVAERLVPTLGGGA